MDRIAATERSRSRARRARRQGPACGKWVKGDQRDAALQRGREGAAASDYARLLDEAKQRIRSAQVKAAFAANLEMLALYWDVGRMIEARQRKEGWGASVIPRLARDIRNELPAVKGFSGRNIDRMIAFYREYPGLAPIVPQPAAKTQATPKVPPAAARAAFRPRRRTGVSP